MGSSGAYSDRSRPIWLTSEVCQLSVAAGNSYVAVRYATYLSFNEPNITDGGLYNHHVVLDYGYWGLKAHRQALADRPSSVVRFRGSSYSSYLASQAPKIRYEPSLCVLVGMDERF